MVDKNLFLHDLAVVAILKNEAPYLKEWIDYYLAAGVDHFYLYDNDSPDNQREVAAPYVKAGLVDYFSMPGKAMQYIAYSDAVNRFKFQCRYMTFIDGDEFIYPKTNRNIVEVVDEILSHAPNAAGLAIHWQCFGSNGHDKADYSRGVLERFTRRAPSDWDTNKYIKTVADPRKINFFNDPHAMIYFERFYSVDENLKPTMKSIPLPVTVDKIVINHYHCKSREEYAVKRGRGIADKITGSNYSDKQFESHDRNEEFDDGILKYRAERMKTYQPPDKSHADERLFNALTKNLSPILVPSTPKDFYRGKMETFLTCRAVAAYLQTKLTDSVVAKDLEEAALKATLRAIQGMTLADARLFLRELPKLLSLPYPAVKDIRKAALNIIPQLMNVMHLNRMWRDFAELNYTQDLLKIFKE